MKKTVLCLLALGLLLTLPVRAETPETAPEEPPVTATEPDTTEPTEKVYTVIKTNRIGIQDGYGYELWKDRGDTAMTLLEGGCFRCEWSNINNALFRRGMKFDCTRSWQEIGSIRLEYEVDYQPKGNSYLALYGWTRHPLVEYYIVESWGSWRPPGGVRKTTIQVDGDDYDIYETTRVQQPSIDGTATFQQYWAVRRVRRTSGTLDVSQFFTAWESLGMEMGKLYEASLTVEGYQSKGTATVLKNELVIEPPESATEPTQ